MKLATGRDAMMHIRPLITAPPTAREGSGARWAAMGTMICTAANPRSMPKAEVRNAADEPARAAEPTAMAVSAMQTMTISGFDQIAEQRQEYGSPAA